MKTSVHNLHPIKLLIGICLSLTACSENNSFNEPQDAIDGYAIETKFNKWKIFDLDGKGAFEDKMLTDDSGHQFRGKQISFKEYVSASVNGFYKIGHPSYAKEKFLLSKELDSDGKQIILGPYEDVGMFYEDITPAVKKGESIIYINKKGETVFDLNERTGLKVKHARNFMGGLSVIGISTEEGIPLYGAINTKGETVIEPKYFELKYFGSGLYYAIDAQKIKENDSGEWDVEILDNTGKMMFTFKKKDYHIYQNNGTTAPFFFTFKDGYGILSDYSGRKWIIVNRKGEELLKSDGTKILLKDCRASKYFAFRESESTLEGIMDINGDIVIPAQYQSIVWLNKDMFCGVKDIDNMEVCNYKGKQFFSHSHEKIIPFKDNYSIIISQGLCEFINTKGEVINRTQLYGGFNYYDSELIEEIWSNLR